MGNPKILILQHVANEPAGTVLNFLKRRNITAKTLHLYRGDSLPKQVEEICAVIIMGGPMNVYEEKKYPFLKAENRFLKKVLKARIPCLGFCLGAQLIAKALGHRVYQAKKQEVGWCQVRLTSEAQEDQLFSELPHTLKVLQWHGDTFDLPKGACRLATSRLVPNQAFCYQDFAYGFQFHVEVDKKILQSWFGKLKGGEKIVTAYASQKKDLSKIASHIYRKFFTKVASNLSSRRRPGSTN